MARSSERRLYRVLFQNQGRVYELYARSVGQGGIFGFIEIEELVFGEKSQLLVDPNEDHLRKEFENTRRIFVPLHAVIRIDEVERDALARSRIVPLPASEKASGESRLTPIYTPGPGAEN
ncbi:MAG: DUF1820 family protein [Leptospirales bacterium]|nr:DUF1820 family protein [Leptospirales bacterium]